MQGLARPHGGNEDKQRLKSSTARRRVGFEISIAPRRLIGLVTRDLLANTQRSRRQSASRCRSSQDDSAIPNMFSLKPRCPSKSTPWSVSASCPVSRPSRDTNPVALGVAITALSSSARNHTACVLRTAYCVRHTSKRYTSQGLAKHPAEQYPLAPLQHCTSASQVDCTSVHILEIRPRSHPSLHPSSRSKLNEASGLKLSSASPIWGKIRAEARRTRNARCCRWNIAPCHEGGSDAALDDVAPLVQVGLFHRRPAGWKHET